MVLSRLLDAVTTAAGVLVVVLIASDVFQSVIVPRPSPVFRPSARLTQIAWPLVGRLGLRIADGERREDFYGTFAPAILVFYFVFWIALLILGFGLVFYGLRSTLSPPPANFWAATYYAGTSLLTLGYGDITAHSGLTRGLSLAAAAIGLGTFAVVTAFLFSLFAAFQRREALIVALRERTGAPPSGVEYILRIVDLAMLDDVPETFRLAEAWMADIMETHLAYPILAYFRSTHDGQSWVGTIGALLDASTLILTTIDIDHIGRAKMLNRLGRHLVNDISDYYAFKRVDDVGIDRSEFELAYETFRAHGLRMRPIDEAWRAFGDLRASYAGPLNAAAVYLRIPPAQWVGDRSILPVSRHSARRIIPDGPSASSKR